MPQILEENPDLHFHLQQQKLIELIRQGRTAEALEYAAEELAPAGEENLAFLEDLGKGGLRPFEERGRGMGLHS